MKTVYIAGPYTLNDVAENVANAMLAWHELADAGFAPFCPHLSHFLHMQKQRPYNEWMSQDLVWLKKCDAVLRLPGESIWADSETKEAQRLEIPLFTEIRSVVEWANHEQDQKSE